ncbi:ABC transporter ATP-binding protein [Desulfobacula sp.]|uniref:ABC transporter ATP-binding protein n=1 Tax=Desulfobacula sp. TaxID=2593537 RepID=UPI0025B7DA65|nr:ABC transporter ATP-binding protein [Desulfobacula sp.]MBC2704545.1 ABC transporter ATP-binding protein [Desulfobacula sp.]
MSTVSNIIEVRQLKKKYNGNTAVDGISLTIAKGSCFGLLGPNGAGKTTIVEMMENIIAQDSGDIFYKGGERDKAFNQEVGIQFQHTELLAFLTVEETLRTFAAFYHNHLPVEDIIALCMLENIKKSLNNKISGGQRQRLLLGLALLNDPELIFLDEPSTGLDPQARKHIWEIIHDMNKKGRTIILTTHYMEEAESLCDTIAIMDKGRIIEQGSPENLVDKHCKDMDSPRNLESVFLKLTGKRLRE